MTPQGAKPLGSFEAQESPQEQRRRRRERQAMEKEAQKLRLAAAVAGRAGKDSADAVSAPQLCGPNPGPTVAYSGAPEPYRGGGGRQQPRGALELLLTRVFGALCGAAFGVLPAARAAAKVATRRAVQSGKIPSLPGIIEPGTGGGPPAKPGAGGLMAEVTAEPPLACADLA